MREADLEEGADVSAKEKTRMVGAICLNGQCEKRELSFGEILLDETLVQGEVWVLREALRNVGGMNYRLGAKRNYELLVRIAKEYAVLQLGQEGAAGMFQKAGEEELPEGEKNEKWLYLEPEADRTSDRKAQEELKTDCYLIGRYRAELLSMGCFDDAVLGIFAAGGEDATRYLEQMIAGTKEFYDIYDCTQPILIYIGIGDVCHNIPDSFSRGLGDALEKMGQNVEYFDFSKQQVEELGSYVKRRFKAVIGMQTYMFSVKKTTGGFLHDEIEAPKYHFVFDHPIWLRVYLEQIPDGLCVLTPDGNYAKFIGDYYGHRARFLPLAGRKAFQGDGPRDYELAFLGSYREGLDENVWDLVNNDRKRCRLLSRYMLYMKKNLRETPEDAFKRTLEYYGITCTREEFVEMFHRERWAIRWLTQHYKNKVITTLLEAGIALHVFGDTWKRSPMWGHPGLIYHEEVTGKDALQVYAGSKLSLNIMTWHKDGFTERIANAMLQKSVVVTDRTTYLEKNFVNGEDLVLFDLGHLEELPGRIRELLGDEEKRKQMAEKGYRKAVTQHTWCQRAEKILEWIEEDK